MGILKRLINVMFYSAYFLYLPVVFYDNGFHHFLYSGHTNLGHVDFYTGLLLLWSVFNLIVYVLGRYILTGKLPGEF